jgi:hypothetical protein
MADFLAAVTAVLHRIRVKLYPCHLPGREGEFSARTDNEKTLSIEEVVASAKANGRFEGNVDHLVEHVQVFIKEVAHLLCDGFAVSFRLFSVHPHVTGLFKSKREGVSEEEHPIEFRFRVLYELRLLAKHIQVIVEDIAGDTAWLDEFWDVKTKTTNQMVSPGGLFSLTGQNIKLLGTGAKLVFVSASGSPIVRISTGADDLVDNEPGRLAGIVPELLTGRTWKVEIQTRYSGGGKELKEPRVITGEFTLTIPAATEGEPPQEADATQA